MVPLLFLQTIVTDILICMRAREMHMDRMIKRAVAGLALGMMLGAQSALAEPAGKIWLNVGDRVQIDKLMASTPAGAMWVPAKIVEVNQAANSYVVQTDDGQKITIINYGNWIKAAGGGGAAGGSSIGNRGALPTRPTAWGSGGGSGGTSLSTSGAPTRPTAWGSSGSSSGTSVTTSGAATRPTAWGGGAGSGSSSSAGAAQPKPVVAPVSAEKPEWERRAGKGAPPAGKYVVHKISGSMDIDIGELVIRGNTYRGLLTGEGTFAPFSMNGDKIVFSKGLQGMPGKDQIVSAKYVGPDEQGRPLIQIYYYGTLGNLEVMDAYRVSQ